MTPPDPQAGTLGPARPLRNRVDVGAPVVKPVGPLLDSSWTLAGESDVAPAVAERLAVGHRIIAEERLTAGAAEVDRDELTAA